MAYWTTIFLSLELEETTKTYINIFVITNIDWISDGFTLNLILTCLFHLQ